MADRFHCALMLTVFRKIFLPPAAEAVGSVGNSQRFGRRVFQARWERWKNRRLFFHGFHGAAVSTAFRCAPRSLIDLGNAMTPKVNLPDSVDQSRPQPDRVSSKGFAESKDPVVKGKP